ncbi:MAG: hypothetical protein ACD_43C00140G0001 [uncultured bacterium]|nr:MAG: hypothetical protein ACD_43C00140G0001 [uncultured bacterium]
MANSAYTAAIQLLHEVVIPAGFMASVTDRDNYRRLWARDSVLAGLAALVSEDATLILASRNSLLTLAKYQGAAGQIASNIETTSGKVSYGGSAGRVDATLWFIIGCGQYYQQTHDSTTIEQLKPALRKAMAVAQAWEFNDRGLLYVPDTGDWADEYTRGGYVLYDQLLYWRAQQDYIKIMDQPLPTIERLRNLIQINYWLAPKATNSSYIYHQAVYNLAPTIPYWAESFSPFGYRSQFDSWANLLAGVFGLATQSQSNTVDKFIAEHFTEQTHYIFPAFYPVITPSDPSWTALKQSYSFDFKNKPHYYHNGGLWPMITGWYVIDLVRRGQTALAKKYLDAIAQANGDTFYEYLTGDAYQPGGTVKLAWNAALYILAERTLQAGKLLILTDT